MESENISTLSQQSQSPFFSIPLEIRLQIYELLLHDNGTTLPTSPNEANRVLRFLREFRLGPSPRYPLSYRSPIGCLFSTCHNMNAELRTAQQSLVTVRKGKPPVCKLDIIISSKYALPTWIVAPVHAEGDVEYDLDVSLRLFDTRVVSSLFTSRGWIGILSYPLMAILNKLVHHGPRFQTHSSPNAKHNKPLRLNAITIDLTFPGIRGDGPCELYYGKLEARWNKVPGCALRAVWVFADALVSSGLLWGKVREIRVYSMQMGWGTSIKVRQESISQEERARWIRRGYVWGPDGER